MSKNLTLGLDIGTTKVAAVLADPTARIVLESQSLDHKADVENLSVSGSSEQSVDKIFSAIGKVVAGLNADAKGHVGAIGITGQMHGVVLFNHEGGSRSHLFTWQDNRCLNEGFLAQLHDLTDDQTLRSGFGVSTLAWLSKYQPELIQRFDHASTVHGYLAHQLCEAVGGIDPSDAASFGLFDMYQKAWRVNQIRACGVETSKLPDIGQSASAFGTIKKRWAELLGVRAGIPVALPIGDNQASLFGSLTKPATQIALTVGTGGQVSVVLNDSHPKAPAANARYEIRPYIDNQFIAVGASLGGGRSLAALANALRDFLHSMSVEPLPDLERIYSALQVSAGARYGTELKATTSFSGERYDQSLRGSLTGISFENFTMGDIFAGLSRGVVESLWGLLPESFYIGKNEVVGSGNAVRRSSMMQRYIEEVFGTGLVVTPGGETTCSGAAFLAGRLL